MRTRKIMIAVILAVSVFSAFSLVGYAEDCNHEWEVEDKSIEDYSETQHKVSYEYYCPKCDDSKTEVVYENHKWKLDETNSYDSISKTMHQCEKVFRCEDCNREKTVKDTQKHHFDKYKVCPYCYEAIGGTINLKPKKKAYLNENTWVKIKVKKKGYLKVNISDDVRWSVYSKTKAVYRDQKEKYGVCNIPVKKGTYYLKADESTSIRYTFKKDPSKKCYTKKKAQKVKKKKTAIAIMFPEDKKKTWTRYFKIKLKKKQKIHLECTKMDFVEWGDLYNEKGKHIELENVYDKNGSFFKCQATTKKMKKGTYYYRVTDRWTSKSKKRNLGSIFAFKWY